MLFKEKYSSDEQLFMEQVQTEWVTLYPVIKSQAA